jgi:hypothetical protein
MLVRRQSELQIFESPLDALERFVQTLNDGVNETPISEETLVILRQHVQSWFDSGKNATKLFASLPMLKGVGFLTFLQVTNSSEIEVIHTPNTESADPVAFADGLFLNFLINPHHASLRDRCAYCNRYFINHTKRKVLRYCTKKCGKQFTSRLANKENREEERAETLERVKKVINEWRPGKSKTTWKAAISERAHVSKSWITRAVRAGLISEPVNSTASSRADRTGKPKS